MLNAKLECHMVRARTLSHEVSVFIYINIDDFMMLSRLYYINIHTNILVHTC